MKKFQEFLDDLAIKRPDLFNYSEVDPGQDEDIEIMGIDPIKPMDIREIRDPARRNRRQSEQSYDDRLDRLDVDPNGDGELVKPVGLLCPDTEEDRKIYKIAVPDTIFIYRPFHFYRKGHWGVLFSERGLADFAINRIYPEVVKKGLPYSNYETLLIATYALGRHAMRQYLAELDALRLELNDGAKPFYKPYFDTVYKPSYPGIDCMESTAASFWAWANDEIRSPKELRDVFKSEISLWGTAFAEGTKHDRNSVTDLEDALAAQMNRCVVNPLAPPEVWGFLPHPHGSSWTRYDAVPWMMTRSLGGGLAAVLNAGPIRKTISVCHVP
jgi:hypothetical protein